MFVVNRADKITMLDVRHFLLNSFSLCFAAECCTVLKADVRLDVRLGTVFTRHSCTGRYCWGVY